MAQRHWLDPIARRLLLASGLITNAPKAGGNQQPSPATAKGDKALNGAQGVNGDLGVDVENDAIELDLLALKLQQNPGLRLGSAAEVRLAAALGWRLDVNRATAADWLRLPGIGADQVDLLLRLQLGGVQLSGADDLQQALDLNADQLAAWLPLLEFRWYSEPPARAAAARVDLNRAPVSTLSQLGLSGERCQRLLRERARAPFRDIAELQQRLQLPADLVESWIGKVRFSPGQAGPALPTPKRPAL